MNKILNIMQAYKAMQFFLEDYYFKSKSDDLGSLLGGMQLFSEGQTWDPAMWGEWKRGLVSCEKITILEAFEAMYKFLKDYCTYVESEDVQALLSIMQGPIDGNFDTIAWTKWLDAVQNTSEY